MADNIIPSEEQGIFVGLTNTPEGAALVTPENLPLGVAGFLFDIEGEDVFELRSDITDHYIEDNTTVQDQWGRLPERITLNGYVGELVGYLSNPNPPVTQKGVKLPLHAALMPSIALGFGLPASTIPVVGSFVAQIAGKLGASANIAQQIGSFITSSQPSNVSAVPGFVAAVAASSSLPSSITNQLIAYTSQAVNGTPANSVGSTVPFSVQTTKGLKSNLKSQLTSMAFQAVGSLFGGSAASAQTKANTFAQSQYAANFLLSDQPITTQSKAAASNTLYEYNGVPAGLSKQGAAFDFFYQLWLSAQTCSVETPWGIMSNMAIENLRVTQTEDSKYISDFSITFKKIRYAKNITVNFNNLSGRCNNMVSVDQPNSSANVSLIPVDLGTVHF